MTDRAPTALRTIAGNHPSGDAGTGAATPLGRSSLLADGAFVLATGAVTAIGAEPLATFLGLGNGPLLTAIGAVFVAYGAAVSLAARRPSVPRWLVRAVLLANTAWVLGSLVVLATGALPLSDGGRVLIGGLGLVVALFAASQWVALRQAR